MTQKTPKTRDKPAHPRRFRLTDRDYTILQRLNRYRYLRTGQVQRLLFPECKGVQMARRRLRNLSDSHYGYIKRIEPYVQIGHGSAETAWYLGRAGEEILRARGERLRHYARDNSGRVKHEFLAHALAISEFRVQLELALQRLDTVRLERSIADFELKAAAGRQVGLKAHILFDEVFAPPGYAGQTTSRYVVHPDLLVLLQGTGRFTEHRQLFFVEIDRGSESLGTVRRKVIGYGLFLEQNRHHSFAATKSFTVLIQTTSPRRAANLQRALQGLHAEKIVLLTSEAEITAETLLTAPIWHTAGGQQRAIVKARPSPAAVLTQATG